VTEATTIISAMIAETTAVAKTEAEANGDRWIPKRIVAIIVNDTWR
jgi:hypothetical protein